MAVDDEVVVGYPVEKVHFPKEGNNPVSPSVGMASVWGWGGRGVLGNWNHVALLDFVLDRYHQGKEGILWKFFNFYFLFF